MAAALLNPDRIEKLSLVCTTPKFLQGDGWAYGSSETAMANLATQFERNYSKALARFFLLQLGTHPDAREMSRQLAAGAIEGATPRWATLKQGLSVLGNTDLRKSVRTINLPTEIIVGTEDRVIPADAGRFLASQIPKATLHEVNAGHVPFLTSPEWFVDHLKKNAEANL